MLVVLVAAGDDKRKADRAVSIVAMAGDEPVGNARILGSNMVERCVWLRCLLSTAVLRAFNFSTFCRLRNPVSVWHGVGNEIAIHADALVPLLSYFIQSSLLWLLLERHELLPFEFVRVDMPSIYHNLRRPLTLASDIALHFVRPSPPPPYVPSMDS